MTQSRDCRRQRSDLIVCEIKLSDWIPFFRWFGESGEIRGRKIKSTDITKSALIGSDIRDCFEIKLVVFLENGIESTTITIRNVFITNDEFDLFDDARKL